ncbi:YbdK family carboxylate-amine ligase [Silvimonas amylolytica]|uniref:Putative glutamate--cysteine ligase 2 n=1 Tax=Silvimonas amylolytica TaxID=449663 RepID=A0ABQ2PK14_9NEIS|nr:YbdK family carboxylate-amine ligase [Silvimonas amylolytica]GGP25947.1 putative glutamate--cysteine ligase 2 [Silvimonas amylolytica]
MDEMDFQSSPHMSMGVELELQVLNTRDYNLTRGAPDLLRLLGKTPYKDLIKPEIAQSMIELNSSIHHRYDELLLELKALRDEVSRQCGKLNLAVAGGGTHAFHQWSEQRIFDMPRFHQLSELYGYLAKQFVVFGQHVHLGCPNGDDAVYLVHMLSRHIPHFIVLSGSSPFSQAEDTAFHSARLNAINAFPLSGHMPFVQSWAEFRAFFERMKQFGVVGSMKDFYWDIRPKPGYGTVELRICDTPLTVEKAAALAAYAQALGQYYLTERPHQPSSDVYELYTYNRFQACRFGAQGNLIDPYTGRHTDIGSDILATLQRVMPYAEQLQGQAGLKVLQREIEENGSDTRWLRHTLEKEQSINDVVRLQAKRWMTPAS